MREKQLLPTLAFSFLLAITSISESTASNHPDRFGKTSQRKEQKALKALDRWASKYYRSEHPRALDQIQTGDYEPVNGNLPQYLVAAQAATPGSIGPYGDLGDSDHPYFSKLASNFYKKNTVKRFLSDELWDCETCQEQVASMDTSYFEDSLSSYVGGLISMKFWALEKGREDYSSPRPIPRPSLINGLEPQMDIANGEVDQDNLSATQILMGDAVYGASRNVAQFHWRFDRHWGAERRAQGLDYLACREGLFSDGVTPVVERLPMKPVALSNGETLEVWAVTTWRPWSCIEVEVAPNDRRLRKAKQRYEEYLDQVPFGRVRLEGPDQKNSWVFKTGDVTTFTFDWEVKGSQTKVDMGIDRGTIVDVQCASGERRSGEWMHENLNIYAMNRGNVPKRLRSDNPSFRDRLGEDQRFDLTEVTLDTMNDQLDEVGSVFCEGQGGIRSIEFDYSDVEIEAARSSFFEERDTFFDGIGATSTAASQAITWDVDFTLAGKDLMQMVRDVRSREGSAEAVKRWRLVRTSVLSDVEDLINAPKTNAACRVLSASDVDKAVAAYRARVKTNAGSVTNAQILHEAPCASEDRDEVAVENGLLMHIFKHALKYEHWSGNTNGMIDKSHGSVENPAFSDRSHAISLYDAQAYAAKIAGPYLCIPDPYSGESVVDYIMGLDPRGYAREFTKPINGQKRSDVSLRLLELQNLLSEQVLPALGDSCPQGKAYIAAPEPTPVPVAADTSQPSDAVAAIDSVEEPKPVPARQPAPDLDPEANRGARIGSVFSDCKICPEMIVVPAGQFEMGSTKEQKDIYTRPYYEDPIGPVTIPRPFAVGVYEVTRLEWWQCVEDGACNIKYFPPGSDRDPASNMSWTNAKEYVAWLSKKTGENYRLLSEAEWEYVARAGTTTDYWWGPSLGKNNARCDECGPDQENKGVARVGSFKPNPFGLYDTAGNVWEWVEDCMNFNGFGYDGAPSDGSAYTPTGRCRQRSSRGGASGSGADSMRVTYRAGGLENSPDLSTGVRVARDM